MAEVIWLILAAVFILAEIMSLGLTSIWFAGGAIVAAVLALCEVSLWIQIIVFSVVSLALLIFTRPIAKKYLITKTVNTNVDSYIGKKVKVIEEINNTLQQGKVKMDDIEWTARSEDNSIIPVDSMVQIKKVSGVKLIVEKI